MGSLKNMRASSAQEFISLQFLRENYNVARYFKILTISAL
jgi:hypothetical protein